MNLPTQPLPGSLGTGNSIISFQHSMDRFAKLGAGFAQTGELAGASREPYTDALGDEALQSSMDKFVRADNTDADGNSAKGVVSLAEKGCLIRFSEARYEGDSQDGYFSRTIGLAPGVPSAAAVTEFKPGAINHVQIEFLPQEDHQVVSLKAVHIDRAEFAKSYQSTLTWLSDYPKGVFES